MIERERGREVKGETERKTCSRPGSCHPPPARGGDLLLSTVAPRPLFSLFFSPPTRTLHLPLTTPTHSPPRVAMFSRVLLPCGNEGCPSGCLAFYYGIENTYTIGFHQNGLDAQMSPELPEDESEVSRQSSSSHLLTHAHSSSTTSASGSPTTGGISPTCSSL